KYGFRIRGCRYRSGDFFTANCTERSKLQPGSSQCQQFPALCVGSCESNRCCGRHAGSKSNSSRYSTTQLPRYRRFDRPGPILLSPQARRNSCHGADSGRGCGSSNVVDAFRRSGIQARHYSYPATQQSRCGAECKRSTERLGSRRRWSWSFLENCRELWWNRSTCGRNPARQSIPLPCHISCRRHTRRLPRCGHQRGKPRQLGDDPGACGAITLTQYSASVLCLEFAVKWFSLCSHLTACNPADILNLRGGAAW